MSRLAVPAIAGIFLPTRATGPRAYLFLLPPFVYTVLHTSLLDGITSGFFSFGNIGLKFHDAPFQILLNSNHTGLARLVQARIHLCQFGPKSAHQFIIGKRSHPCILKALDAEREDRNNAVLVLHYHEIAYPLSTLPQAQRF